MADISIIVQDMSMVPDDPMDDSDEGVFEQADCQQGLPADYEEVSTLLRIQKCSQSTNSNDRQWVSRLIPIWFKNDSTESINENISHVMQILQSMGECDDSSVRQNLLDEIPYLSSQARRFAFRAPVLNNVTSEYLIPIILRNIGSSENIIEKAAHNALLELLDQKLITLQQVEIQICPFILGLTIVWESDANININPNLVTLMSKMVRYLGREITERVFLNRFIELCSCHLFYIRKVCASHIAEFCSVVSNVTFEKLLLPCYLQLCKDQVSGVRNCCAEVAMYISCICPPEIRKDTLTTVYETLLQDECRWVRLCAFNSLGAFISTFSEPSVVQLAYNINGDLIFATNDGNEYRVDRDINVGNLLENNLTNRFKKNNVFRIYSSCTDSELVSETENLNETDSCEVLDLKQLYPKELYPKFYQGFLNNDETPDTNLNSSTEIIENNVYDNLDNELSKAMKSLNINNQNCTYASSSTDCNSNINKCDSKDCENISETNASNSDTNLGQCIYVNNRENEEDNLNMYNSYNYWYIKPELPLDLDLSLNETLSHQTQLTNDFKTNVQESIGELKPILIYDNFNSFSIDDEIEERNVQQIVPQVLIDHYISMTKPNLIFDFDDEMAYQCAYSLPAVALTLGSLNWHLLKKTVYTLAGDRQYKVRRAVASYLYDLAVILGPDITTNSLTPLFDSFMKDLDEVRIGILKNMANFLRLISPIKRSTYLLPKLRSFLRLDHECNWRFKEELANQLIQSINLFKPSEAAKHINIIAQELLCDKVAAVRQSAMLLMTELIKNTVNEPELTSRLLIKLAEKFAHSKRWKHRQTFSLLCCELLASEALSPEVFDSEVMPHLLDLSWDPVANIRLVVARAITNHIVVNDYFADPDNQHIDSLDTVIRRLQADKDRDVRESTVFIKKTSIKKTSFSDDGNIEIPKNLL